MNTVTAATPARELPASIRMASRLLNTSCGQLSQLPSHLLAFRARGRKILGLRLHRRAQGIALRFRPSLVHAHLTQFSLHLLAPRLQLAESLGRGASFGGQLCAILVQLRGLALLDDQRLVGLSDFHLQLLDLLLVQARILVALFLAGVAEVLQCLVRDAVRGPHCGKGGVRFGQLGAKRSDIRGQLGGFRLDLLPLRSGRGGSLVDHRQILRGQNDYSQKSDKLADELCAQPVAPRC